MLSGVEGKVVMEMGRGKRSDEEEDIRREETAEVIKQLKDGKTMEIDRILNEVWKHESEKVTDWMWGAMQ